MEIQKKGSSRVLLIGIVTVLFFVGGLFAGCASQKQAKTFEESGFLDDYSILSQGPKDGLLRLYKNPEAKWANYNKILLEPVEFYERVDKADRKTPQADIQRMVNNFESYLKRELSKDYEMVTMPGPRTLRIHVAVTNIEKTKAPLHTVSSILPVGWVVSGSKDFATGKPLFVGEVGIEFKMEDAEDATLLAAGVDRRVGGRELGSGLDSWAHANKIMEIYSKLARFRLCQLRGGTDCIKAE
jgi:hypothetical protein